MDIYGLAVLGLFIVAVVMLAVWNSQSKSKSTVKSEARNDREDWVRRTQ